MLSLVCVVRRHSLTWPWPRTWCFEFIPPGGLGHVPGVLNSLHLVAMATCFVTYSSFSLPLFFLLRGHGHVPGALNLLHLVASTTYLVF